MKLKDLLTRTNMEHCKIRIIEVRPKPLHNIDIAYLYDFSKYQIAHGIVQDYLDFNILMKRASWFYFWEMKKNSFIKGEDLWKEKWN